MGNCLTKTKISSHSQSAGKLRVKNGSRGRKLAEKLPVGESSSHRDVAIEDDIDERQKAPADIAENIHHAVATNYTKRTYDLVEVEESVSVLVHFYAREYLGDENNVKQQGARSTVTRESLHTLPDVSSNESLEGTGDNNEEEKGEDTNEDDDDCPASNKISVCMVFDKAGKQKENVSIDKDVSTTAAKDEFKAESSNSKSSFQEENTDEASTDTTALQCLGERECDLERRQFILFKDAYETNCKIKVDENNTCKEMTVTTNDGNVFVGNDRSFLRVANTDTIRTISPNDNGESKKSKPVTQENKLEMPIYRLVKEKCYSILKDTETKKKNNENYRSASRNIDGHFDEDIPKYLTPDVDNTYVELANKFDTKISITDMIIDKRAIKMNKSNTMPKKLLTEDKDDWIKNSQHGNEVPIIPKYDIPGDMAANDGRESLILPKTSMFEIVSKAKTRLLELKYNINRTLSETFASRGSSSEIQQRFVNNSDSKKCFLKVSESTQSFINESQTTESITKVSKNLGSVTDKSRSGQIDYDSDEIEREIILTLRKSLRTIRSHKGQSECLFTIFVRSAHPGGEPKQIQVRASPKQVKQGYAKKAVKSSFHVTEPLPYIDPYIRKYARNTKQYIYNTSGLVLAEKKRTVKFTQRTGTSGVQLTYVPMTYEPQPEKNVRMAIGPEKLPNNMTQTEFKEFKGIQKKIMEKQFPGVLTAGRVRKQQKKQWRENQMKQTG